MDRQQLHCRATELCLFGFLVCFLAFIAVLAAICFPMGLWARVGALFAAFAFCGFGVGLIRLSDWIETADGRQRQTWLWTVASGQKWVKKGQITQV